MTRSYLRRLWPLAVVAVLLALAALASGHSSLQFSQTEVGGDDAPNLPENVPTPPAPEPAASGAVASANRSEIPEWIFVVAGSLLVLAIAAGAGAFLWMLVRDLRRRRTGRTRGLDRAGRRQSAEGTTAEVVAALDAGLVDLSDNDADPRRAVIACWVRLEQAAAGAGIHRRVGDTPTDLVSRLLRGSPGTAGDGTAREGEPSGGPVIVSADVLAAFAQVYREARYATHTVDERMRTQARSALTRLRAELTAEVSE